MTCFTFNSSIFLWIQGALPSSIGVMPYSGQNDLVEVRLRQLSYHIGSTLVSSGLLSALLAPDCTKNAGIISFFEPPSATTLTKGLLLILDHIFTSPHPCPLIQTPTATSPLSHLPLTSTLQTQKLRLPRRRKAELYEVDWKHPCPFPNFARWRMVVLL